MVFEGVDRPSAAAAVGLSDTTLRIGFSNPVVLGHYRSRLEALRTSELARNIHTAIEVRDDPALKETAAGQKVRLEGARFLEPRPEPGSVTVNVGVGVEVQQPGYVVAISPEHMAAIERDPHTNDMVDVTASREGEDA